MATMPCAVCGNFMQKQKTSLPEGQARCHSCRRAYPQRAKPKPKPSEYYKLSRGLTCAKCCKPIFKSTTSLPQGQATCRPCRQLETCRPEPKALPPQCKDCGGAKASKRHWYCEPCRVKHRRARHSGGQSRATSEERGYGSAHRKARLEYLAAFNPGDPCSRCHEPMHDDPAMLDLDHNDERTGYLGLAHRACNRSTTGRPTIKRHPSVCDECGLTYLTGYADQRFCSNPCRRKAQADRAAQRRTLSPRVLEFKLCDICWSVLTLYKRCSNECRVEHAARYMRDRYRTAHGLPADPNEPTSVWLKRRVFPQAAA